MGITLLAWAFWPAESFYVPWLCLASAVTLVWYMFSEAKFPSLFTWFAIAYLALFLVYPVVAPLAGLEIPTRTEVLTTYCFLAVVGVHLFLLGYTVEGRLSRKDWDVCYGTRLRRLFRVIWLLSTVNVLGILLVLVDAGSLSTIALRTRVEMKLAIGTLGEAGTYCFLIGGLLFPLVAVYIRQRPLRAVLWAPLIVGFEVFLFLAFRMRTYPLMHAVGFLVGWFLIAPRMIVDGRPSNLRFTGRFRPAQVGMIVLVALTIVVGLFVLRTFRGGYETAGSIAEVDIDVARSVEFALNSGELGYSNWVFRILELVPSHYDYMWGQSYYRLLFLPIPRTLWPNKPYNSQIIFAQWIFPGAVRILSIPVGIIGDLYANFGPVGIVGMFLFGYVFGQLDRGRSLGSGLLVAASSSSVFHLVRGGFTNPVVQLALLYIIARLVSSYLCETSRSEASVW